MAGRTRARIDELARITDGANGLTRLCFSPAMQRANDCARAYMESAGMTTRVDGAGNLIGRWSPPGVGPGARTLCIGSHLDTVIDAGRYDGALGVLAGIACVEALRESNADLPFHIDVAAFSDEEGVRFQTAYFGSSYYNGTFDPAWLTLRDGAGETVADALRAWGGDPDALLRDMAKPADLLAYVELHIEQGPVLEQADSACGVVRAICGQSRVHVSIEGRAGHAGNTPMHARRDALVPAALVIAETERLARADEELRATVGAMEVEPNAANVIPGRVAFTLDVRHPDDATREAAVAAIRTFAREQCRERGVNLSWTARQDTRTVDCDRELSSLLEKAIAGSREAPPVLVSGAGHDAVSFRDTCPIALLFVRCRDGLSHHPDEFVDDADIEAAERALVRFVRALAERHV